MPFRTLQYDVAPMSMYMFVLLLLGPMDLRIVWFPIFEMPRFAATFKRRQ